MNTGNYATYNCKHGNEVFYFLFTGTGGANMRIFCVIQSSQVPPPAQPPAGGGLVPYGDGNSSSDTDEESAPLTNLQEKASTIPV
jgi:hypothetical protein